MTTKSKEQREIIPRAQTRSLVRGLRALEYVGKMGEASVSEVAEALELPRASAHILLSTLTREGYLRQAKRRGRYQPDLRVLPLTHAVLQQLPVRERAASLLHELAQETGLPAYLAVLSKGEAMTIDRVVPRPMPQARVDLGHTNPGYASSLGKALLAHLPKRELEEYLATVKLEPLTERTITSTEQLREEFAQIRKQGYALSEGEHRQGVRSIASPIFSYEGDTVAAVCIRHYTPFDQPPPLGLIQQVKDVAQRISYSLGYGVKKE
jgi:DNA-binding IclR family transcriptional regulator